MSISKEIKHIEKTISELQNDIYKLKHFNDCNLFQKLEIIRKTNLINDKGDIIFNLIKDFKSSIINNCKDIKRDSEYLILNINKRIISIPIKTTNSRDIIIKDTSFKTFRKKELYDIAALKENIIELEKKHKSLIFSIKKKHKYKKNIEAAKNRIFYVEEENKKIQEENKKIDNRIIENMEFIKLLKEDIKDFIEYGYCFKFNIGIDTKEILNKIIE